MLLLLHAVECSSNVLFQNFFRFFEKQAQHFFFYLQCVSFFLVFFYPSENNYLPAGCHLRSSDAKKFFILFVSEDARFLYSKRLICWKKNGKEEKTRKTYLQFRMLLLLTHFPPSSLLSSFSLNTLHLLLMLLLLIGSRWSQLVDAFQKASQ